MSPSYGQGLRRIMENEEDVVVCGEAERRAMRVSRSKSSIPDVMIADISLKQSDGIELGASTLPPPQKTAIW